VEYSVEQIRAFDNLELLARQLVEGYITGLHKSPYHGFSVEFAEHRQYNTGESTRFIDWRVFSRTEKLYVKQFEEETNLRCQILLDISPSMFFPEKSLEKITFAIMAASSLTVLLEKQRDAVGLLAFDEKIKIKTAVRSNRRHIHDLILNLKRLLERKAEGTDTDLDSVLHEVADQSKPRSLLIIFSDFLQNPGTIEGLKQALNHLKYRKHEVILFNIYSTEIEKDLKYRDIDSEFIDVETGKRVKINPFEIRKEYKNKMMIFHSQLKEICGELKIDFHDAPIEEGYYPIFSKFLLKRMKMR
jgi:uncharacterized protein (DUF58 family)